MFADCKWSTLFRRFSVQLQKALLAIVRQCYMCIDHKLPIGMTCIQRYLNINNSFFEMKYVFIILLNKKKHVTMHQLLNKKANGHKLTMHRKVFLLF